MVNRYQVLSGDVAALESAMATTQNKEEFRRFQAVYLRLAQGMGVQAIAEATRFCVGWVLQLHGRYKQGGLDALRSKPKGGRRHSRLSREEECAVLATLENEARSGGILEVGKVHQALEQRCGTLSKQTTYNILHRHGWRKIAPRPRHPKSDKEAQEAFKKNGRKSSRKPGTKPPRQENR